MAVQCRWVSLSPGYAKSQYAVEVNLGPDVARLPATTYSQIDKHTDNRRRENVRQLLYSEPCSSDGQVS